MNKLTIESIYTLYWDKMLNEVCKQFTNNQDEAKDLCQNAFIKIHHNLHKYTEKGSLEGWVRRVVKNTLIDEYRRKKLPTTLEVSWKCISNTLSDEESNLLEKYHITIEDVLKVKNELPQRKLRVFNMVLEGYKHKEIAEELGISEGTSKSTYSRAKSSLKKILLTKNKIVENV
tara:strand:- start:12 stop:533 length:522 start_codon:yes stop_codon:yes gene_type:complete